MAANSSSVVSRAYLPDVALLMMRILKEGAVRNPHTIRPRACLVETLVAYRTDGWLNRDPAREVGCKEEDLRL